MLDRLLHRRRRPQLQLAFERRECIIVPQTRERIALHADVHFAARADRATVVIEDAHLVWESPSGPLRRTRWDRAVVEGRFRYPPQPLEFAVGPEARALTLTFDDPLIPHDATPPPPKSTLSLELTLSASATLRRLLWRVERSGWDAPPTIEWLAD